MKLIDLLVQELSKRDGWPRYAYQAAQDYNGTVYFYTEGRIEQSSGVWKLTNSSVKFLAASRFNVELAEDYQTAIVTREQYEAALAALKQPKWNGEGLPPVGALIEVESQVYGWVEATVTAVTDTYLVAQYKGKNGVEGCMAHTMIRDDGTREKFSGAFRPIRDKAGRHRDEALKDMREACTNYNLTAVVQATREIYDAIAAGKIKGVMLKEGED